eukprot:symbB.v1.2.024725.t1/scaffold2361.1/size81382/1
MGPSRGFWRIVRCVCVFATAMGFEDGTDACETACPGISDLLTNAEPLMEANSLQSKEEAWNLYCENKTIMDCATSSCAGTLVLGKVIFKSDADELSCVCGSCPDVVKFKEILAHLIFSQTLQQEWDYGCPAVSTMTCMKQSCAEYYGSYPPPSIKDKEVFQTSGADNCTAQNLSTTFPENWTVPAMPTANPHLEKCKTSCPEYMAMDTAAGNLTWLRDYDGAQNVRCATSNSTNQCIIDDPDCYAFFGLNRFNLTKEEEVMQFDCGCGTCPPMFPKLSQYAGNSLPETCVLAARQWTPWNVSRTRWLVSQWLYNYKPPFSSSQLQDKIVKMPAIPQTLAKPFLQRCRRGLLAPPRAIFGSFLELFSVQF